MIFDCATQSVLSIFPSVLKLSSLESNWAIPYESRGPNSDLLHLPIDPPDSDPVAPPALGIPQLAEHCQV